MCGAEPASRRERTAPVLCRVFMRLTVTAWPRVAEDQARCGTKIPVSEAEPGDLIFYGKEGRVYHVVLYAGNGKTIEAANSSLGIIQGVVNTERAVWAARIISGN